MKNCELDFAHAALEARHYRLPGERAKYALVGPLGKFAKLAGKPLMGMQIATCVLVPRDAVVVLPARIFEIKKEDTR